MFMKCLSIQQPWAWGIIHDQKRIENRTWSTPYRGTILIHAGKSTSQVKGTTAYDWDDLFPVMPDPMSLVRGALIGVVDLIGCVPASRAPASPFREGPWCWLVENPRPLAAPIPMLGKLGLFNVDLDALGVTLP